MSGSRICGPAFGYASRHAPRAASWNAMSEESTVWNFPSNSFALMSTTW